MTKSAFLTGVTGTAVAFMLSTFVGCESDPDSPDAASYLDSNQYQSLARTAGVSPDTPVAPVTIGSNDATATLENDGDKIVLTATGGSAAYTWTVLDASLGHLMTGAADGESVVYVRDAAGDNAVQVRDSDGRVANVTIKQP